jgi:hypothetical protein
MEQIQEEERRCLSCQERLEVGHIPDLSFGAYIRPRWFAGRPKKSWLSSGLKGLSISEGIVTLSYRCRKCGLLHWYAQSEITGG